MEEIYIINFKAYPQGVGEKAVRLAEVLDSVSKETGKKIVVAVQPSDIWRVASRVSIPVFAQHIDGVSFGSRTGHVLPEAVVDAGAEGTLINHSERRLRLDEIARAVERAKEVGLQTVVCAGNVVEAKAVAQFEPDFVAIEPPELIGGDVSVSRAKPEVIAQGVRAVAPLPLLVGAGVKSWNDVKKAVELGARGVLVASGIVKAEDPREAMLRLVGAK